MPRASIIRLLVLLPIIALSAIAAACGGRSSAPGGLSSNPTAPAHGIQEQSLAQALADLDALKAPAGVDGASFAQLKAALRTILMDRVAPAAHSIADVDVRGPFRFASRAPEGGLNMVDDLTAAIVSDDTGAGQPGIQWSYRNAGDYNFDGQVNISDLLFLAAYLGSNTQSGNWASAQYSDGDGNGEVNLADVTPIGSHFLSWVVAWQLEGADSPAGPFTVVQQVPNSAANKLESGLPVFSIVPAGQHSFYRVVPLDNDGQPGAVSNVSTDLLLSPQAEIIGSGASQALHDHGGGEPETGPQFVALSGDTLELLAPEGHGIMGGDVLVGGDAGGYILNADKLIAQGDTLTVNGSPGQLSDVVAQGVLTRHYALSSPDGLSVEFAGAMMNANGVDFRFYGGSVELPDKLDLMLAYDRLGFALAGLSLHGQELGLSMDLQATGGSGSSAALARTAAASEPAEQLVATIPVTATPLDEGGLPLPLSLELCVYAGASASGELSGTASASFDVQYADWRLNAGCDRAGNVAADADGMHYVPGMNAPFFSALGDFQLHPYVRIVARARAFSGTNPGADPDFALNCRTSFDLTASRATGDPPGYDYAASVNHVAGLHLRSSPLAPWPAGDYTGDHGNGLEIGDGFVADGVAPPQLQSVSGMIDLEGTGMAGVEVSLRDGVTNELIGALMTNGSGAYSFEGLIEGGSYTVTPVAAGYAFSPPQALVNIGPFGVQQNFLASPGLYHVHGLVTSSGSPLPDAVVELWAAPYNGPFAFAMTLPDGTYDFTDVPGGRLVTIVPRLTGYAFTPPAQQQYLTGDIEVHFDATQDTHTLSGAVVADLLPLPDVTLELRDASSSALIGTTSTDASGQYAFAGLPAGLDVMLTPSLTDHAFAPSSVTLSMDADAVQNFAAYPSAFSLSGTVMTGEGSSMPVPDVLMTLVDQTTSAVLGSVLTDSAGAYLFEHIPAGTLVIVTPSGGVSQFFSPSEVSLYMNADLTADFLAF